MNRIDTALLAAAPGVTREQAITYERSAPFGAPADMGTDAYGRSATGHSPPRTS